MPPRRRFYRNDPNNKKSTLYAFAFVGCIGVLYLCIHFINNYVQRQREAAYLAKRELLFESAERAIDQGYIDSAKLYIRQLKALDGQGNKFSSFHHGDFIHMFLDNGIQHMGGMQYEGALVYFEELVVMEPDLEGMLKDHLVESNLRVGRYSRALNYLYRYLEDARTGDDYLKVLYRIGVIHADSLQQVHKGREQLYLGVQRTLQSYKGRYGEAYALLLDPSAQPWVHYQIWAKYAELSEKVGAHQEAIDAAIWAEMLNPRAQLPAQVLAKSHWALGHQQEACMAYNKAIALGDSPPDLAGLSNICL